MKKGIIKITLHSAIAAGSGYAFAGVIDSDICYDQYGFPFIPARRIKGCMRDVAERQLSKILNHHITDIFGVGGNDRNVGFSIGNAHIEGRDELSKQISEIRKSKEKDNTGLARFIDQQDILDQFTTVKAQTKMENGVADNKTLRYTRTVNETSPITSKPMVFVAKINYEDELEKDLEIITKGLRNIGLMRNRGLGSVSCILEEDNEGNRDIVEKETLTGDLCEISYVLTNVEPLMISASREDVSLSYIPGQNVLGLLAGRYLAEGGRTAEDEAFIDLFLNGKTTFTNVVPYKAGHEYYPAPAFINRLKKTKKLVNAEAAVEMENADGEYATNNGNLPKKLKGKYVAEINHKEITKYDVHEVNMKIVYHHNQREESIDGSIGKLYTQQVITEDQSFAGRIILPIKYVDMVISMLTAGDLFFGKSKTAQYGRCRLENIKVKDYTPETIHVDAGEEVLVTLLSDGIFIGENGYTVDYNEVLGEISSKLRITPADSDTKAFSIVQTKKIYGYQTKWNLRKQPVPAIEAGSVYAIKVANDTGIDIKADFVGERNLEGFGRIRVFPARLLPYKIPEEDGIIRGNDVVIREDLRKLITTIIVKAIKEKAELSVIDDIDYGQEKMGISSSLRGRITLMLSESIEKYNKDAQWKEKEHQADYISRIESISSDKDRKKIIAVLKKHLFNDEFSAIDINKLCSGSKEEKKILIEKLSYTEKQVEELIGPLWSTVLMTMLVNDKYMKGE